MCIIGLALFGLASHTNAGPVDPPFVVDNFQSRGDFDITLLPAWTGLPDPITESFVGFGPTVIHREIPAFVGGIGTDTVDTEIVSMSLVGNALGGTVPVEVRAGTGFAAGLSPSLGEIREASGTPPNGVIDVFPISSGDSFFDVFVDLWIDLNTDSIINAGELVRNSVPIRMANIQPLTQLPPLPFDQYAGTGPIELVPVDPINGNVIGPPHALIDNEIHTVVPEPTNLALMGLGLAGFGYRQRRNKKAA